MNGTSGKVTRYATELMKLVHAIRKTCIFGSGVIGLAAGRAAPVVFVGSTMAHGLREGVDNTAAARHDGVRCTKRLGGSPSSWKPTCEGNGALGSNSARSSRARNFGRNQKHPQNQICVEFRSTTCVTRRGWHIYAQGRPRGRGTACAFRYRNNCGG